MRGGDGRSVVLGLLLIIVVGVLVWASLSLDVAFEEPNGRVVAVSMSPLDDFAKQIAGDTVEVRTILPTGKSPHAFDPSVEIEQDLISSDTLFIIGQGIDPWGEILANRQSIPLLDLSLTPELLARTDGTTDPHYWLSIPNAIVVVEHMTTELTNLFPEFGPTFETNAQAYIQELERTDLEIRGILDADKRPKMVQFHDAFQYFATTYNVELIGAFQEIPGEPPSEEHQTALRATIQEQGVNVIFSDPQFSRQQLDDYASRIGVKVVEVDPIGGTGNRDTYIETMLHNARMIAENQ